MDNVLQGKSALVVGGTSGIGYCLVQSLLQEFVSVVVQGQSKSKRITSLCEQGNIACFICDLQKGSYVEELCQYANAADILCVSYGPFLQKPLDMTTAEEWNTIVYANLTLPGILVSSALAGMKERKWGRILLFGGTETHLLRGFRTNAVYGVWNMLDMASQQMLFARDLPITAYCLKTFDYSGQKKIRMESWLIRPQLRMLRSFY